MLSGIMAGELGIVKTSTSSDQEHDWCDFRAGGWIREFVVSFSCGATQVTVRGSVEHRSELSSWHGHTAVRPHDGPAGPARRSGRDDTHAVAGPDERRQAARTLCVDDPKAGLVEQLFDAPA